MTVFYGYIILFQKIIPFQEVTSVRRAKTAGIFPNAIEIVAAGKKVIDAILKFHNFVGLDSFESDI